MKAKKVLIGVGIGCGALLVIAVALVVAGGLWAKKTLGGVTQTAEAWKAQDERFEKLEQEHPFAPPAAGQPMALQEDRLRDYLAVRAGALPTHQDLVAKARTLKTRPQDQEKPDLAAALGAGLALYEHVTSLRKTFLEGLEAHRMSVREFGAITMALYTATTQDLVARRRDELRQQLQEMNGLADGATGVQKTLVDEQIKAMKKTLETLPSDKPVLQADAALLAKYKDEITRQASPAFDMWIAEGLKVNVDGYGLGRTPTEGPPGREPAAGEEARP